MSSRDSSPSSYEAALNELRRIVRQLEQGTTTIDELSDQLARADELIRQCRLRLRQVEADVKRFGQTHATDTDSEE